MDGDGLVLGGAATLLGSVGLWLLWYCWTGRYRGWAKGHGLVDRFVVGLWPPVALLVLGVGLAFLLPDPVGTFVGVPLVVIGTVLAPFGLVALFLPRRWWGPRWYRRLTDDELGELTTSSQRLSGGSYRLHLRIRSLLTRQRRGDPS